jgi:hypothetical protein
VQSLPSSSKQKVLGVLVFIACLQGFREVDPQALSNTQWQREIGLCIDFGTAIVFVARQQARRGGEVGLNV